MNLIRSICNAAATGIVLLAFVSPAASFADEQEHHHGMEHEMGMEHHHGMEHNGTAEERAQWIKKHLDHEAAMLEIKASQESAWEAFSAASLELMANFGERKPLAADADAAAIIRQHAERSAAVAQNLAKLADAADKLQAVLSEDQRKVFDRIVRMHSDFRGGHHEGCGEECQKHHHGHEMSGKAAKTRAKAAAPADKPKN